MNTPKPPEMKASRESAKAFFARSHGVVEQTPAWTPDVASTPTPVKLPVDPYIAIPKALARMRK